MSKQRAKLVVGNWKMHGRLAENAVLLRAVAQGADALPDDVRVGVCVPSPYLAQAQALLEGSRVVWGVQDVSAFTQGAYTGEVAAPMAVDFGASLAIVGHSERRAYHRESAELVAVKTQRALEAGLTPIVCVGETLEEREAGKTEQVVGMQLDEVLAKLSSEEAARIVVAYEPVWAIGTGKSATSEQAQDVHAFLRSRLAQRVRRWRCAAVVWRQCEAGERGRIVPPAGYRRWPDRRRVVERPGFPGDLQGGRRDERRR